MGKLFKGLLAGAALAWCGSAQAAPLLYFDADYNSPYTFSFQIDAAGGFTMDWETLLTGDSVGPVNYSVTVSAEDYYDGCYPHCTPVPITQTANLIAPSASGFINQFLVSGYWIIPVTVTFSVATPDSSIHVKNLHIQSKGSNDIYELDAPGYHALPEPSSWAMLLIGFAAIGTALRRRRHRIAAV